MTNKELSRITEGDVIYCDKCKCDAPNNKKWDFCPNCGADMRESEVEE